MIAVTLSTAVRAQHADAAISANSISDGDKLASWIALDAPTGHEHLSTDPLMDLMQGWSVDRNGNLIKSVGSGTPHRVIACGLDWYSYAVSQITQHGYLRLHRIGRGSGHPLWDQSHQAQQLRILTRGGPLLGVSAIANGHFASQHRGETSLITADDLWLDVGASSADEVAAMGIQLLDPVVRHLPPWSYAQEIAGPGAGARIGCAAIAAAAQSGITGAGRTTWVMSTQQVFGWVGLAGALRRLAPVDDLILLGPGQDRARDDNVSGISRNFDRILAFAGVESIRAIAPRVNNPGSLMERITVSEATRVLQTLVSAVDDSAGLPAWIKAPERAAIVNEQPSRLAGGIEGVPLVELERLLDRLAQTSAVPEHEGPVRAIVLQELPEWARARANTDSMGNLWVEAGPAGTEATVFIAHMDEVCWDVASIDADGVVNLTPRGGVVMSAWEGQPALLQLDAGTGVESAAEVEHLKGVFLTRSDPGQKTPDRVRAWFGMTADQLSNAGVRAGMGVTGYKEGHRLGRYRYASRTLDDRAGTTALLMAIKGIDPEALDHRVIFAFSVQEEGGLRGAGALSARFGKETRRVYSIDTFVSSDTPLESPHFAYAPLGAGPVLRSIESSSMSTPRELDRNRSIATDAGINFQFGLTQGGTDGTTFTFWGAPNAGLSWPGRYSHSPAEIADLRDLVGLVDLIRAMAMANPEDR